jgi:hypothetical protein
MRAGIWVPLVFVLVPGFAGAQASIDYAVIGATTAQETLLRTLIQKMQPEVLPLRAIFVPHWKYVADARIFRVHVPTGYISLMFTHLPTRTVFIDTDRIQGEQFLAYWIAHELGHLAANSVSEEDAEKAASALRKRLKTAKSPAWTN